MVTTLNISINHYLLIPKTGSKKETDQKRKTTFRGWTGRSSTDRTGKRTVGLDRIGQRIISITLKLYYPASQRQLEADREQKRLERVEAERRQKQEVEENKIRRVHLKTSCLYFKGLPLINNDVVNQNGFV